MTFNIFGKIDFDIIELHTNTTWFPTKHFQIPFFHYQISRARFIQKRPIRDALKKKQGKLRKLKMNYKNI